MTVIRYGAPEGFPDADSPGPPHRGNNFFCGGAAGETTLVQELAVGRTGLADVWNVVMSGDEESYAYSIVRSLSVLNSVEGVR